MIPKSIDVVEKRTGIEFSGIAHPFQSRLGNVVQRSEIEISRHSMDTADANFMEATEQIL